MIKINIINTIQIIVLHSEYLTLWIFYTYVPVSSCVDLSSYLKKDYSS